MNQTYVRKFRLLVTLLVIPAFWVGCSESKPKRQQSGQMDNVAYHTQRGDDAIAKGDLVAAQNSFDKSLELNANYSPALSGKALTVAGLAIHPGSSNQQKTHALEKAQGLIEKALENAQDNIAKARAHSFAIRVYVTMKMPQEEWYEKVREHFESAVELSPDAPEAYLYMARAEANNHTYAEATKWYNKVLALNKTLLEEANAELVTLQKIQRAQPGSKFGKEIAFIKKISRADISALFIAELRLERLYKDRAQKFDTGYVAPQSQQGFKTESMEKVPEAMDIMGHPMEETIKEIIKLGVKGLEPDAAHKFHPDKQITRAEYALMIQDILIKVTQENSLATKFLDTQSPFPDVRADMYYYNAARVVIGRNLMQVTSKVTGEFAPQEPVSGADALLTIRDMKEVLRSYLR